MSIASEIQDLQNNLELAKLAVTTKGGTVGDTGLAGLATEIASIPSGGGGADWGTVTYLDANNQSRTVTMKNLFEFNSLGRSSDTWTCTIDGVTIDNTSITEVNLGKDAIQTPANFMRGCVNLTSINAQYVEYVSDQFLFGCGPNLTRIELPSAKEIGTYFMSTATSDCEIVLSNNLTKIGSGFLNMNSNRNKPLVLPQSLTSIGTGMMCLNSSMASYIDIGDLPASIISADSGFRPSNPAFAVKETSSPAYVSGIGIKGSTASAWLSKFPNGSITVVSGSMYRHLYVYTGNNGV